MRRNQRSFLKWTGGKGHLLPRLARAGVAPRPAEVSFLVDPFLGGGASFLFFRPRKGAVLGDIDPRLVAFYRHLQVGEEGFVETLRALALLWDELPRFLAFDGERPYWAEPLPEALWGEEEILLCEVARSLEGRRERSSLETVARREFYSYLRLREGESSRGEAVRSAYYYFVRELAFGGMFRRNRQGRFNAPYGGRSYDRKRFLPKVEGFLLGEGRVLLRDALLLQGDFAETLQRTPSGALAFLDPPYMDSFSAYDGHPFALEDHRRLLALLQESPNPFLLVVGGRAAEIYRPLKGRRFLCEGRYSFNIRQHQKPLFPGNPLSGRIFSWRRVNPPWKSCAGWPWGNR